MRRLSCRQLPWAGAVRVVSGVAFAVFLLLTNTAAQAQTTFDVIGPHEYDLPVNYSPFNVFVQYTYIQDDAKTWDSAGDRVAGSGGQRVVGLSKYVHFWTPDFNHNIGMAYEVIQPEISIRNPGSGSHQISGFGDTITGFATWFKPTPNSTFGFQSFVQIPWGDADVSDTNWKNLSSFLWDVRLPADFGWTADAGFVWQSTKDDGTRPGTTFHTNQRFGWKANQWFEPYLALDYEHTEANGPLPTSWVVDGGIGLMVNYYKAESISLRYSTLVRRRKPFRQQQLEPQVRPRLVRFSRD